jgi:hypothetical protein
LADTLIREQTAFQSQPLSPVPQYWNATALAYEKVQGANGAIRTLLYDANGNPLLTAANPGKVDIQSVPVVGTHGNAWNAVAVAAGGDSVVIDTQYQPNISVFGNASAATTITAYVSQDGTNFYKTANEVALSAAGNFHFSFITGARYVRLKSSAAATITATVAGK